MKQVTKSPEQLQTSQFQAERVLRIVDKNRLSDKYTENYIRNMIQAFERLKARFG